MRQALFLISFYREKTEALRPPPTPHPAAALGSDPSAEALPFTAPPRNCLPWLSTSCLLPSPFIRNPIHIYKLIQRAAVAAMNLWIRSTGSNCNFPTILWRYLRAILWNPNQMWFTPKDSNSSSSWSGKMKFAEELSLRFETPYTCLPQRQIPI